MSCQTHDVVASIFQVETCLYCFYWDNIYMCLASTARLKSSWKINMLNDTIYGVTGSEIKQNKNMRSVQIIRIETAVTGHAGMLPNLGRGFHELSKWWSHAPQTCQSEAVSELLTLNDSFLHLQPDWLVSASTYKQQNFTDQLTT